MEPIEYLKIVQRRWTVVLVSALVAAAATWVVVPADSPGRLSIATHTLQRAVPLTEPQDLEPRGVALGTVAELAATGPIPERVAQRLGGSDAAAVAGEVAISPDLDAGTIAISSTQLDGERAATVANIFAEEIVRYFDELETARRDAAIEALAGRMQAQRDQLAALEARVGDPGLDGQLAVAERDSLLAQYNANLARSQQLAVDRPSSGLGTLQAATPNPVVDGGLRAPSTPVARFGLAALLGLGLGVVLALALERVDTRVRTRRGAELAFGLPTVTEVPRLPLSQRRRATILTATDPASVGAEAFRLLRLALQLMPRHVLQRSALAEGAEPADGVGGHPDARLVEGPAKVILVTSPGAGEGKTSTVANLAASFAEGGKLVCCLDCDIRHPRLHAFLGGDTGEGVTDFLGAQHDDPGMALSELARETTVPGVWLVPRGSATENPGNLMGSAGALVAAAAELADIVLIDAGPLLAVGDPAALAPHVDAVVVVARSGRTTAEDAHRTTELLARVQAPVLGVALVGAPRTSVGRGYYTSVQAQATAGDFLRGLQRRGREEREPS